MVKEPVMPKPEPENRLGTRESIAIAIDEESGVCPCELPVPFHTIITKTETLPGQERVTLWPGTQALTVAESAQTETRTLQGGET